MNTKLWLLSFCLFFGIEIFSQNEKDSVEESFSEVVVESMPVFREGDNSWQELMDFISRHLRYPATAWEDSVEGRVIIIFTVERSGDTDNHKVVRGVREDLDNEALRVAKLLKFEVPAIQRGKPVRVRFTLPVVFDLKQTKSVALRNIDFSEDTVKARAKEFIISHSSGDFFDSLFELGVAQINDNKMISTDYYIRTGFEKKFYYRQVQDKKTITANDIEIHFNEQQEIIDYPDIGRIYQGFSAYQNAAVLSEEETKELSDSFSKNKNMRISDVKYIYDLDREKLYLEVIRQKKDAPGVKERQQIDMQNNKLIKKTGPSFFRMLFYYLDKIFW
ncbi:hypothetical protein SDC9_101949 [bioreactor metagenome]|uniref:TonB C-terminal domain-containing protein n=1 Tax=bioreactor metagenome TaxID=1076179 RepID=A0A645AQG9_9ZZZZ